MTAVEVTALNRARTVILMPGMILEEHGPFLPISSDGIVNDRLTDSLASAIAARPGWTAVIVPTIPLGNSAANDIGARFSYPGTYAVRFETLRAVFMDLADEFGAQGFRWIFVVHLHGGPNHSRALDDAGDYFHATYRGRMVHLAGLQSIFGTLDGPKTPAERAADGLPIHAGMDETSLMQHLASSLVRDVRSAPDQADSAMEGLVRRSSRTDWPGYFGAPRLARPEYGARIWSSMVDSTVRIALRILDGQDPVAYERFATVMERSAPDVLLDAASRREEARRARRQAAFLRRRDASRTTRASTRR